jgi:integrase
MGAFWHKARGGWRYKFQAHGRVYWSPIYLTKRAAMDAEATKRRELGLWASLGERPTVAGAAELYLREVRGTMADSTVRHATKALDRFVAHVGSGHLMETVTSEHVESYKRARLAMPGRLRRQADGSTAPTPLSGATVNRDLIYLSSWFNWCRRKPRRWLSDNPASTLDVKRYAEPWPQRDLLTATERDEFWTRLEKGAGRVNRIKAELLYHLAVRKSVVLHMTWPQVSWDHAMLSYRSKGKDRLLPLNTRALALLRELHGAAGGPTTGRVFVDRSDTTLRRWWDRIRVQMGHPGFRRHDMRVSAACDLASRGADMVTIREVGGWGSLAMVERYLPPYLRQVQHAVETLVTPEAS